jgi:hypothetical protein
LRPKGCKTTASLEQSAADMNNKEKRAKFRELAKHDRRIRTARELVAERDLPFMTDCLGGCAAKKSGLLGVISQRKKL